jgi:hypothetical protein
MRTAMKRSSAWGPKALAVVSFALALLAVQPAPSIAAAQSRAAVTRDAGAAASLAMPDLARQAGPVHRAVVRQDEPRRASTKKLHMLATIEIVQRLLAAELRPVEQHLSPLVWLEPICIETLVPPALADDTSGRLSLLWRAFARPHAEESYLIEHCLLAPPVA